MCTESSCSWNEPLRARFHLLAIEVRGGGPGSRGVTHFRCTAASLCLGPGEAVLRTGALTVPYNGLTSWHEASQYTPWCVLSDSGSGMVDATAASRSVSNSRSTSSISLWFSSAESQPFLI